MAIDPLSSLSSFGSLGITQAKKAAASNAPSSNSGDFASVLSDLAKQTASTLKASEDTAIKGIQGQAPVQDVVQSVMRARDHRRWSRFSSKAVTRFHRRRPPIFMKVATSKSSQHGARGG
jgi:flagellar hook-basal body complex protein FliE